jgi:hypothetical protein
MLPLKSVWVIIALFWDIIQSIVQQFSIKSTLGAWSFINTCLQTQLGPLHLHRPKKKKSNIYFYDKKCIVFIWICLQRQMTSHLHRPKKSRHFNIIIYTCIYFYDEGCIVIWKSSFLSTRIDETVLLPFLPRLQTQDALLRD